MTYGLFYEDKHIYTYDKEQPAKEMALRLGDGFYVRKLTIDEYCKRLKEIYVEGKYK